MLENAIVDLRINETLQTGGLGKRNYRLVGAVSNCTYSVRLKTAPTRGTKVSIYFLKFTINPENPDSDNNYVLFELFMQLEFCSKNSVASDNRRVFRARLRLSNQPLPLGEIGGQCVINRHCGVDRVIVDVGSAQFKLVVVDENRADG